MLSFEATAGPLNHPADLPPITTACCPLGSSGFAFSSGFSCLIRLVAGFAGPPKACVLSRFSWLCRPVSPSVGFWRLFQQSVGLGPVHSRARGCVRACQGRKPSQEILYARSHTLVNCVSRPDFALRTAVGRNNREHSFRHRHRRSNDRDTKAHRFAVGCQQPLAQSEKDVIRVWWFPFPESRTSGVPLSVRRFLWR